MLDVHLVGDLRGVLGVAPEAHHLRRQGFPTVDQVQVGEVGKGQGTGQLEDLAIQGGGLRRLLPPGVEIHRRQDAAVVVLVPGRHDPDRAGALAQQLQVGTAEKTVQDAVVGAGQLDHQVPVFGQNLADGLHIGRAETDLDVHVQAVFVGLRQGLQLCHQALAGAGEQGLQGAATLQDPRARRFDDLQQGQPGLVVFRQGHGAGEGGGLFLARFDEIQDVLEVLHLMTPLD